MGAPTGVQRRQRHASQDSWLRAPYGVPNTLTVDIGWSTLGKTRVRER